MRLNDRSDGSIGALLILVLVAGNSATLSPNNSAPPPPESAAASPAVSRASRALPGSCEDARW